MKNKIAIFFNALLFKSGPTTRKTSSLNEEEKRFLLATKCCPDCEGELVSDKTLEDWHCNNCGTKFNLKFMVDFAPNGRGHVPKELNLLSAQRIA